MTLLQTLGRRIQQHCCKPSAVEPRHCYGFSAMIPFCGTFPKDSKSTALGLLGIYIIWYVVSIKKCKGLISFIDKTCEFFLTDVFAFLDFWHFLQQASATLDQEENGNLKSTAKTCLLQHTASPRIDPRYGMVWQKTWIELVIKVSRNQGTSRCNLGDYAKPCNWSGGLNGEGKKGGKGRQKKC